jgi:hypothetical protein
MKKRKRTDKSRYKHESTGDYCTCAAYVAEIMCKKNAENKNQGSLPFKFWSKKPWNWTFVRQVTKANELIKKFSEEAIAKAVNSPEFRTIFSLNHPSAESIISKYDILRKQQLEKDQHIEVKENPTHRKKKYGKRGNMLNKLRKMQDGETQAEES